MEHLAVVVASGPRGQRRHVGRHRAGAFATRHAQRTRPDRPQGGAVVGVLPGVRTACQNETCGCGLPRLGDCRGIEGRRGCGLNSAGGCTLRRFGYGPFDLAVVNRQIEQGGDYAHADGQQPHHRVGTSGVKYIAADPHPGEAPHLVEKERNAAPRMAPQYSLSAETTAPIQTTQLKKIRLSDDQEPWISGKAEIYAIVTGVNPSRDEPALDLVEMPYLDYDNKDYYPNQIVIHW